MRNVILVLSANPETTTRLAIDREVSAIMGALQATPAGNSVDVCYGAAVGVDEIIGHCERHQPQIIHFVGHGTAGGLVVEGRHGETHTVPAAALARLIASAARSVDLVVLNACFTDEHAAAIAEGVGCAIGMRSTLEDSAAIELARAFYRKLGLGGSVAEALDQAQAALAAWELSDDAAPRCVTRAGVNAAELRLRGIRAPAPPPPEPPAPSPPAPSPPSRAATVGPMTASGTTVFQFGVVQGDVKTGQP